MTDVALTLLTLRLEQLKPKCKYSEANRIRSLLSSLSTEVGKCGDAFMMSFLKLILPSFLEMISWTLKSIPRRVVGLR